MNMSQIFKNMTLGVNEPEQAANVTDEPHEDNEEEEEDEQENSGEFIVGLQPDGTILKKTVYLTSNEGDFQEYRLIILKKDDFYITFIVDSNETQVDVPTFYTEIQTDIFIPVVEQFETLMLNGSVLQSSITSLKTLYLPNEIDQEFFYIIYDPKQQNIQSSLPYLPYVGELEVDNLVKYQIMAIYYLHDQLSKIFNFLFLIIN